MVAREKNDPPKAQSKAEPPPSAYIRHREVYDLAMRRTRIYAEIDRAALNDEIVRGPVVVPEAQTTTLVRPGWIVHCSNMRHLILEREAVS